MTSTATEQLPESQETAAEPAFMRLEGIGALSLCDRHAHVFAVVEITRADWKSSLLFCGNCARRNFGYEHTAHAVVENRLQGSEN